MATNIFKITLTLDANNAKQLTALNDLLAMLAGTENQEQVKKQHEKSIDKIVEQNKKEAESKNLFAEKNKAEQAILDKAAADKKAAAESKKVEAEKPAEKSAITIEQVRAEVTRKSGEHRDAIKKKLTDLGCNNVATLEASKYPEFMAFLKEL